MRMRTKKKGKNPRSNVRRSPRPNVLHDIFDPQDPRTPPTIMADGLSFRVDGVVRSPFTHSPGERRAFFLSNVGSSATLLGYVSISGGTAFTGTAAVPTINTPGANGGASSGRALKASLTLVNTTSVLNRGGRVTILHLNQRLSFPQAPQTMTVAEWNAELDQIVAHPKAVPYSAEEFVQPKALVVHPVDQPRYTEFSSWQGSNTIPGFFGHIATWLGIAATSARPMSTIAIVFEAPAIAQDYQLSSRGAWLTRWPVDSVLGQSMHQQPTAPASVLNGHLLVAEANAGVPRHIVPQMVGRDRDMNGKR